MDKSINLLTLISTVAIIVIPIVAVVIGQYLQNRSKRRDDRMSIFKTLMTNRFFRWTNESVHALNIIEIVFAKDKEVLKQWAIYKDKLTVENPTQTDFKKIEDAKNKLLETMAKSLGYDISWETIQNPYLPKGMMDNFQQQQNYQNNQTIIMEKMKEMLLTQDNTIHTLTNEQK